MSIVSGAAPPQALQLSLDGLSYLGYPYGPPALPCWPKTVRLVSNQQPVDVWLYSITDANNAANNSNMVPSIAPGAVAWQRINSLQTGTNLIQINNIPGLAYGRTYNVRCWVLYSAGSGAASAGVSAAAASAAGSNG